MKKHIDKQFCISFIQFIILPFVINIILESLGNESFFGGILKLYNDPYIFLCNTLIIAATISPGVFLKRFRIFWIGMISFLWIVLGTVNFIVVSNRVLPLTAYDFQLLDSIPFIVRKYLGPISLAAVCLGVVILLLGVMVLFFRALAAPKEKLSLKKSAIFFVSILLVTYGNLKYATSAGHLETRFPELSQSFIDNGYAYSFMLSLVDGGVDEVEGYSPELINSITKGFCESDDEDVKKPNIIFLQMESFFDLNALKSVKFSSNPVPNLTKLMAENPSGLLTVPVIGAGTVNTEFEVVTGMRIADFGAGEYPYKTILLTNTCESVANNLKEHGYTSHFIHNYRGNFYGRNIVYANLGYDYFYSLEHMTDVEVNENGWARDKILTRYINECLDSTEGTDLITTISVQGHGSYSDKTNYTRYVTVDECSDSSMRSSYEYYANQIYEMDQFIGELMDSISQRDEETVLIIYGDHFPSLSIENDDLKNRNRYQTDYVIWNNLGIEYEDEDLFAYQLSSKVLEGLNITDGVINLCHQQYRNDANYLFNLQALEYDVLYGEKYAYNGDNPYPVSLMKKNYRIMTIHSVTKAADDETLFVISGNGFSKKTIVKVGYKTIIPRYVDEHTLQIKNYKLNETHPISVWEKDVGESANFYITETGN